jgi:hypothetical protein
MPSAADGTISDAPRSHPGRLVFAASRATVGRQPAAVNATLVWALPSPSGLNAHWSLEAMVAEFARFGLAAAAPSRDTGTVTVTQAQRRELTQQRDRMRVGGHGH